MWNHEFERCFQFWLVYKLLWYIQGGNSSRCTLQEAPPPNYSQISIRTLPPTYSQGCRITHYHPSTGNVSQQTTSTGNDVPVNEAYSSYIADTDFTVSPSNDNNETIDDVFDAPTNTNSETGNNVCQTQVSNDNNSDNRQSRTHIENDWKYPPQMTT